MLYNKSMVQDQLVDYISSQMKLGVSRDAIKAALTGAGWAAADVEDTLKKVEGANKSAAPAGMAPASAMPATAAAHSIRVSDLVSGGSASPMASPMTSPLKNSIGTPITKMQMQPIDLAAAARTKTTKGGHMMTIVWIVVIVLLLGLSGYLYFQNSSLSGQVASLGGQSTNVASQISSLNAQVQALTASNTALMAQEDSLMAQNTDLMNNLSFVAVPVGASGAQATGTVSVSGTLTGGKSSYALTTAYGVVIYVANAKTASVSAALTPLVGSTSTVQLTGSHVAGSQYITVTAVNGSSTIQ